MSIKSFIQILIILLIISIIAGVYYRYFDINNNIVEEINTLEIDNQEQLKELEKKVFELELKNSELIKKIDNSDKKLKNISSEAIEDIVKVQNEIIKDNEISLKKTNPELKIVQESKETKINENVKETTNKIKNLVKDVEYNSIDERGNKFYLLANSGKSNINNKDILDLVNVRGEIKSDNRDTIYIVSDFAQFNSVNSNSKFYENVVINYQEKQINCVNFDINMETNKAIAYNKVIITDPKSTMKAGIVEFDLKTKNININPESVNEDIEVVTN